MKVTLGQFDRCFPDVTSQNVSVSAILLHPDFSPGNRAYDIALVRLNTPVQYEKRMRPICLSFPGDNHTLTVTCTFTAFYRITYNAGVNFFIFIFISF